LTAAKPGVGIVLSAEVRANRKMTSSSGVSSVLARDSLVWNWLAAIEEERVIH
jgi:hypothetical protein